MANFVPLLSVPRNVIKHGRNGKPKPTKFYLSDISPSSNERTLYWGKNSQLVHNIVEVKVGCATPVFEKSSKNIKDHNLCFSIIFKDRSLDLELDQSESSDATLTRDQYVEAFRWLVEDVTSSDLLVRMSSLRGDFQQKLVAALGEADDEKEKATNGRNLMEEFGPVVLSQSCFMAASAAKLALEGLGKKGKKQKIKKYGLLQKFKTADAKFKALQEANIKCQQAVNSSIGGLLQISINEGHGLPVEGKDVFLRLRLLGKIPDVDSALNQFTALTTAKSANPIWHETCALAFTKKSDVLMAEVFTKNSEPFGYVLIPLSALSNSEWEGTKHVTRWFALLDGKGNSNRGGFISLQITVTQKPLEVETVEADERMTSNVRKQTERGEMASVKSLSSCKESKEGDSSDEEEEYEMTELEILDLASNASYQMADCVEEEEMSLKVFVGTWNCGNAAPSKDLSSWLGSGGEDACDLYAIASQECGYKGNDDLGGSGAFDYIFALSRHFGREYTLVKYHSLLHIRLALFVRNPLVDRISRISFHSVPTGIGGVYGNKGGVITEINFMHTSLAFVSSHLAAHQQFTSARNQQARDILKASPSALQCDHMFWAGDLNYRLHYGEQGSSHRSPSKEQFDEMVQIIREGCLQQLSPHDQLRQEMVSGRVFAGFCEGDGIFECAPTFKVHRGKVELAYFSNRSPAWCDRVLWRSLTGLEGEVDLKLYKSAPEITSSDHKPVSAVFNVRTQLLPPLTCPGGGCSIEITQLSCKSLPSILHIHSGETMSEAPISLEGTLGKTGKGGLQKGFNKRYFVLTNQGLSYYKAKDESLKGTIPITPQTSVVDVPFSPKPFTFGVKSAESNDSRTYYLSAASSGERDQWVTAILAVVSSTTNSAGPSVGDSTKKSLSDIARSVMGQNADSKSPKSFGTLVKGVMKQTIRGAQTNPYLSITSHVLNQPMVSPICKRTTNPKWEGVSLTLPLETNNPARIACSRLHVNVMCQGERGIDTLLCSGVISLAKCTDVAAGTAGFEFTSPLSAHASTSAGTLHGRVSLKWIASRGRTSTTGGTSP